MQNMSLAEMIVFWPLAVVLAGLAIVCAVKFLEGGLTKDTGFADDYLSL
jgi:hypothetical protein